MFKSIEFIIYDKDPNYYSYKLIDTEFECEGVVSSSLWFGSEIISEYKKRNYSHKEIVKNLFVYNIIMCNKCKCTFEDILNLQKYQEYYQDLKDMWNKYKAFM